MATQVRNRLVHPTGALERIYRQEDLVKEVWLLIRHYLVLLILHSLRCRGSYRDLRRTSGWAFDRAIATWSRPTTTSPQPGAPGE